MAVRRPAPPNAPAIHAFLRAVRATGFVEAPEPRHLSDEGWEELEFIQGDVPLVPYPWWSMGDDTLASVGRLLRRYHDSALLVPVDPDGGWSAELADPEGGPVLCHDDVCQPNVVFRDRRAAGLIDFDFVAPGRPVWDVAMTARYWVPVLDPQSAAVTGLDHLDPFRRLRVLADGYGLDARDRRLLPGVLVQATAVCRAFVAGRVAAGEQGFVDALATHGGWERWDRIESWVEGHADRFADSLGDGS